MLKDRSLVQAAKNTCKYFSDDKMKRQRLHFDGFPLLLLVPLLVGIGVRLYFVWQPMRNDEAFTFLYFILNKIYYSFYYLDVNNHVLHTLFVNMSCAFFGTSELAIRLPALLAGILIIPMVYFLCQRLNPRPSAGMFAASLVSIFPLLVLYSTNARGYTIIIFFMIALLVLSLDIIENELKAHKSLFVLTAALSIFCSPVSLFFLAGIFLWIILVSLTENRKSLFSSILLVAKLCIYTACLVIIFYSPVILTTGIAKTINKEVISQLSIHDLLLKEILPNIKSCIINGIAAIVGIKNISPEPVGELLFSFPLYTLKVIHWMFRQLMEPFSLLVIVMFIGGAIYSVRRHNTRLSMLITSLLLGAVIVLVIFRKLPPYRNWLYFIPIFSIFVDYFYCELLGNYSKVIKKMVSCSLVIIMICFASYLVLANVIIEMPDTGSFPEAERVAIYLSKRIKYSDNVISSIPADYPLKYYIYRHGLKTNRSVNNKNKYFVVQQGSFDIQKITKDNPKLVWKEGKAKIFFYEAK